MDGAALCWEHLLNLGFWSVISHETLVSGRHTDLSASPGPAAGDPQLPPCQASEVQSPYLVGAAAAIKAGIFPDV